MMQAVIETQNVVILVSVSELSLGRIEYAGQHHFRCHERILRVIVRAVAVAFVAMRL